ncbi:MAG TPA: bile acid:sodium symporter [Steroidobacteraceae bacterium]|nr:bile acid:sodium symporter [Steroidobacteraceae bacterium]
MNLVDDVLLPGSLWCIMLSMGLSLTVDDFRRVFVNRRGLFVGVGSMLVVPPLIGLALALLFAPTPALAVGFVLLATCPGGMLSNLMTDIARGDLALSIALTLLVSLIYIAIVPFYAYLALLHFMDVSQQIEVPLAGFVGGIIGITLVPAGLGLLVRAYWPALAMKAKDVIKTVATAVLVGAFVVILVGQVAVLRQNFWTLFWMTLGMNLLVVAAVIGVTRITRLNRGESIAVCIEHMIRQEGTAIFIAVTIVGSREMSLPMIMNTPVALVICIAFVTAVRRYLARSSATAETAA